MTTKTYYLSTGYDFVVTGQPQISTGEFGPVVGPVVTGTYYGGKNTTVIIDAPDGEGIFLQNTFNSGDNIEITNLVTNNALYATFGYNDLTTDISATVSGIQIVAVKVNDTDATLEGGFVTNNAGNAIANYQGLTTVSLQGTTGEDSGVSFGSFTNPLEVMPTHVNAQSSTGTGAYLAVWLDSALFTSPVTVNVSLNTVGNPGTHQSDSQAYVHGSEDAFALGYGSSDGTVTATTWDLNVTGKNYVELYTHGATNTTTINVAGTGSLTLFGVADEFYNVTTIKDTASGAQVITGALQEDGAFKDYTGFLSDNSVLTSISVTSSNAGNFVDLSGFDLSEITAMSINIGGGTVVLANEVLNSLTANLSLGKVTNIGDGGDYGDGSSSGGTINWAFLPATANTLTFYHGEDGAITLNNTPNTFTVNFDDKYFFDDTFSINAMNTTSLTNSLTLLIGCTQDDDVAHGLGGVWTTTGYDTVNIHLAGSGSQWLGIGGFTAVPNSGGTTTINISGTNSPDSALNTLHFGDIYTVGVTGYTAGGYLTSLFEDGVTTFGKIVDTAVAYLELGVTDAVSINAATAYGLDMEDPGSDILGTFTVVGSVKWDNNLQGAGGLGTIADDGSFYGFYTNASITGGTYDDNIWTAGDKVAITLGTPHATYGDTIYVDQFQLNSSTDYANTITDNTGDAQLGYHGSFASTSEGVGAATITNFVLGPATIAPGSVDELYFNTSSWGGVGGPDAYYTGTGGTYYGLTTTEGAGGFVPSGDSVPFVVGPAGVLPEYNGAGAYIDLVAYQPGTVLTAATLESSINGAFGFTTSAPFTPGDTYSMLFAYTVANGTSTTSTSTEIADVEFFVTPTTHAVTVEHVQNLVDLVGVSVTSLVNHPDAIYFG
jgi:hypothetical protein